MIGPDTDVQTLKSQELHKLRMIEYVSVSHLEKNTVCYEATFNQHIFSLKLSCFGFLFCRAKRYSSTQATYISSGLNSLV